METIICFPPPPHRRANETASYIRCSGPTHVSQGQNQNKRSRLEIQSKKFNTQSYSSVSATGPSTWIGLLNNHAPPIPHSPLQGATSLDEECSNKTLPLSIVNETWIEKITNPVWINDSMTRCNIEKSFLLK